MRMRFRPACALFAAVMLFCLLPSCACSGKRDFSNTALWGRSLSEEADTQQKEYAASLFDTSFVHEINVEIAEDDWNDLKANPLSKTKYKVNVTIDGSRIENVSFATKGNTSLSQVAASNSDRYSFKLNFRKYDKTQTYQGLDKLNLNNMMSDATCMKDYLSYLIMRKAGASASLTSYAALSINGEFFGLYIAIEDVSDSFLERNYGDGSGALYKPETERLANVNGPGGPGGDFPGGNIPGGFPGSHGAPEDDGGQSGLHFEPSGTPPAGGGFPDVRGGPGGSPPQGGPGGQDGPGGFGEEDANGADLKYIDDNISSYSAIFDNTENDVDEAAEKRLIAALKVLADGENIGTCWDIRQVIRYFTAHNFVLNYDSYTGNMLHNYYLYEKDGTAAILPWDYNLAFGGFNGGSDAAEAVNWGIDSPLSGAANHDRPLWNAILSNEEYLSYYHECYDVLLKEFFESGECAAELKRVYELIRPYVEKDPSAFYTVSEFDAAYETLVRFCDLRAKSIRKQLDGKLSAKTPNQTSSDRIDASGLIISKMGSQGGGDHGGDPGGFSHSGQPGSPPGGQPGNPPFGGPGSS